MPFKTNWESKTQQYLDAQDDRPLIEKGPDVFYGYYTVHSLDTAGNTVGMLSVNGYTGQVWYHIWQGKFIGMAIRKSDLPGSREMAVSQGKGG